MTLPPFFSFSLASSISLRASLLVSSIFSQTSSNSSFLKKKTNKFYFKFNIKGKTITHYCICTVNVCFLLNIFHFKQNINLIQLKDYTLHIIFFPIFLTQRKSIFVENTNLQAQINFQEIFQTLSDQHINSCSGQHIYWALPEFIQFIFDHP